MNLENPIVSLTPSDAAPYKGFGPVGRGVIDMNSQLFDLRLDPLRFGVLKALPYKGFRSRGFKSHYPARGRKHAAKAAND